MSNRQNVLKMILGIAEHLDTFKDESITKEDLETVEKIREELNKLAGPEDIMSVKIIKKNILERARKYMLELIKREFCSSYLYRGNSRKFLFTCRCHIRFVA